MRQHLHLATACCLDAEGRLLVVRKQGTRAWMLPGGKREPQETPEQTLVRELQEELHWNVPEDALRLLGQFEAPAANEADTTVHAHAFLVRQTAPAGLRANAEIAALQWLALDGPLPETLAPLLRQHILPALRGALRQPA